MSPRLKPNEKTGPRLIVLSAPSVAGKTTLCDLLLKDFKDITLSVSTTTRPMRPYEKEGVHYHFVTPEVFQAKIKANDFAEWAKVHENLYGTSKSVVDAALAAGKRVLFDIDVQGAMSLLNAYKDKVLLVFSHPPSMQELEKRLRDRKGDSLESIEKRLQNAYNEVGWSSKFDYQITNDNLEKAYRELKSTVLQECYPTPKGTR